MSCFWAEVPKGTADADIQLVPEAACDRRCDAAGALELLVLQWFQGPRGHFPVYELW